MKYDFTIPGRMDGMNDYTRACRAKAIVGHKMKGKNQAMAADSIMVNMGGTRIAQPVRLHFKWFEPNKKRDHDNVSSFGRKVIQDALVECGVLAGDGWKYVIGFTDEFFCDRENPRIEVEIEEVDRLED